MLLSASANAQLFGTMCDDLFGGSSALTSSSTYVTLMSYSVEIVLAVFMVLGIVYAVAMGFGINSLKEFVKTELLEGVFNIAIIMICWPES